MSHAAGEVVGICRAWPQTSSRCKWRSPECCHPVQCFARFPILCMQCMHDDRFCLLFRTIVYASHRGRSGSLQLKPLGTKSAVAAFYAVRFVESKELMCDLMPLSEDIVDM